MSLKILSNRAKADFKSITDYTQKKYGKNQRKTYQQHFYNAFNMLADNPRMGKKCDDLKEGYRKCSVESHVIFYRVLDNNNIKVMRILHKREDWI